MKRLFVAILFLLLLFGCRNVGVVEERFCDVSVDVKPEMAFELVMDINPCVTHLIDVTDISAWDYDYSNDTPDSPFDWNKICELNYYGSIVSNAGVVNGKRYIVPINFHVSYLLTHQEKMSDYYFL